MSTPINQGPNPLFSYEYQKFILQDPGLMPIQPHQQTKPFNIKSPEKTDKTKKDQKKDKTQKDKDLQQKKKPFT